MTMTTTAHQMMHMSYCPADENCESVGGPGGGNACRVFDERLRQAEAEHTQAAAQKLLDMSKDVMLVHGSAVTQGLLLAYKTVAPAPYYKEPES